MAALTTASLSEVRPTIELAPPSPKPSGSEDREIMYLPNAIESLRMTMILYPRLPWSWLESTGSFRVRAESAERVNHALRLAAAEKAIRGIGFFALLAISVGVSRGELDVSEFQTTTPAPFARLLERHAWRYLVRMYGAEDIDARGMLLRARFLGGWRPEWEWQDRPGGADPNFARVLGPPPSGDRSRGLSRADIRHWEKAAAAVG